MVVLCWKPTKEPFHVWPPITAGYVATWTHAVLVCPFADMPCNAPLLVSKQLFAPVENYACFCRILAVFYGGYEVTVVVFIASQLWLTSVRLQLLCTLKHCNVAKNYEQLSVKLYGAWLSWQKAYSCFMEAFLIASNLTSCYVFCKNYCTLRHCFQSSVGP